jgi:hypothetical protein
MRGIPRITLSAFGQESRGRVTEKIAIADLEKEWCLEESNATDR